MGAGCRTDFNYGNWSFVYNGLSFGIASMGSAMIYVWLMIGNVAKPFKPALAVNGIVRGIATYQYFRIFNSWNDAFEVFYDAALGRCSVQRCLPVRGLAAYRAAAPHRADPRHAAP